MNSIYQIMNSIYRLLKSIYGLSKSIYGLVNSIYWVVNSTESIHRVNSIILWIMNSIYWVMNSIYWVEEKKNSRFWGFVPFCMIHKTKRCLFVTGRIILYDSQNKTLFVSSLSSSCSACFRLFLFFIHSLIGLLQASGVAACGGLLCRAQTPPCHPPPCYFTPPSTLTVDIKPLSLPLPPPFLVVSEVFQCPRSLPTSPVVFQLPL